MLPHQAQHVCMPAYLLSPAHLCGSVVSHAYCCCCCCCCCQTGDRFRGVLHRPSGTVVLYSKAARGHGARAGVERLSLNDPALAELLEPDLFEQLQEDVELLEVCEGSGRERECRCK